MQVSAGKASRTMGLSSSEEERIGGGTSHAVGVHHSLILQLLNKKESLMGVPRNQTVHKATLTATKWTGEPETSDGACTGAQELKLPHLELNLRQRSSDRPTPATNCAIVPPARTVLGRFLNDRLVGGPPTSWRRRAAVRARGIDVILLRFRPAVRALCSVPRPAPHGLGQGHTLHRDLPTTRCSRGLGAR